MKKKVLASFFLYFMFFSGSALIICGCYFLQTKEIEVYESILKNSQTYFIKTYNGKVFYARDLKFYKEDENIYIKLNGKIIPVS